MKKFEYCTLKPALGSDDYYTSGGEAKRGHKEKVMNELGKGGWELVATTPHRLNTPNTDYFLSEYIFKRAIVLDK